MHRTICITGASSGIGLATARRFLAEGWNVIATGRREDRLRMLADECPGRVLPLCFDIRDEAATARALALSPGWEEVDVLVNNAGLALGLEPAQRASWDEWKVMLDTNIRGLTQVTHLLLPGMVARGRGHVVNVGSIAGSYAYPGGNVYGASKAFVEQFSRNLRCDLHGTGIRVSNIEPGLLETEFSLVRFKGDSGAAARLYAGTDPLRPEDIAESIWWVCAQPAHVNIGRVEIMPVCQSHSALQVFRKGQ